MRKISILSSSIILIVLFSITLIDIKAQSIGIDKQKSLEILFNEDNSIRRVEVSVSHNMTLDSLVQLRNDLHDMGITVQYKRMEFDTFNLLVSLDCHVICNDGFSGSFGTGDLRTQKPKRFGFYRDYSADAKSPFGTGLLENKQF